MIENRVKQSERLEKVNKTAKKQIDMLRNDKNIVGLNKMNNSSNKLLKE